MGIHKVSALAGVIAAALWASAAQAAVVYQTDATSGWTVTRATSTATSGAYNAVSYTNDPTVTNFPVVVVSPINPAWTAQNDPRLSTASWISNDAGSGTGSNDPLYTRYTYNGSFTLGTADSLSLTFAADNLVDELIVSTGAGGTGTILADWTNTVTPLGDPSTNGAGRVWGFTLANVQNTNATASGTVFIDAITYNFDTALVPPGNPGPHGFILAVDADDGGGQGRTTPLPGAVWGGLALIGMVGTGNLLRRRRRSA